MANIQMPKSVHSQVEKARSSLISTKALLSQGSYQRHVINERHKAIKQLKTNITNAHQLVDNYQNVFENSGPANVLGGKNVKSTTAAPPDGDNARIVLNALPSGYDFPALVSSLTKILGSDNIQSPSVGGSDQSDSATKDPAVSPQPISIDAPISGTTDYAGLQKLIHDLQRSTRPYNISSLQISGTNNSMSFNMQLTTYYQPPKSLDITQKVIKK
jgi:hypothetical protein